MKQYYVYILGNSRPTLYVGITSNLSTRMYQHTHGQTRGFSRKYGLTKLLWFEVHSDVKEAIRREKQIKEWKRDWKLAMILTQNPGFEDLCERFRLSPE